jgi:hypothetical protein
MRPGQTATCPQFLWINLCEIAFPHGKSLILIREISAMKKLAACNSCAVGAVEFASAHFLWTKLCARAHSDSKALDSKGKSYRACFLSSAGLLARRPALHTNCGKQCVQGPCVVGKPMNAKGNRSQAQNLGRPGAVKPLAQELIRTPRLV